MLLSPLLYLLYRQLSSKITRKKKKNNTVALLELFHTYILVGTKFDSSATAERFCFSMQISWWRLRSLVDSKKSHGNKETLTLPGDHSHAIVPGLTPFSEYSLIIMTFNGRGNGPGSHPVNFKTLEGGRIVEKHGVY